MAHYDDLVTYDSTAFEDSAASIVYTLRTCCKGWSVLPTDAQLSDVFETLLEAKEESFLCEADMWKTYDRIQQVACELLKSNFSEGS